MPVITADILTDTTATALRRAGVPCSEAALVTRLLVKANLAGHDSHGVVRVPGYIRAVRSGRIRANASIDVIHNTSTSARVLGNRSFGQIVVSRAVEVALAISRGSGLSLVSAQGYSHCGQLGSYAEMASAAGQIGLVILGKQRGALVPWGGRGGRLYQNTLAIAVPSHKPHPVVLDMAASVAPFGKILMKRMRNEQCPDGWLVDADGNPSNDPNLDLSGGGGGLLPLGSPVAGHKGSGLAFMLGILATVLSGQGAGGEGLLVMTIDPDPFTSIEALKSEVDAYVDYLNESPAAPGVDRVLVPGERSYLETQRRTREGVYVEQNTWDEIVDLAAEGEGEAPGQMRDDDDMGRSER